MQKYLDMKERVEKTQVKLSQVKNPDTKTAIKMATDLKRWQAEYEELEKDKDRIVLSKTCVKHLDQWIAKVYYKRQKLLFVDHIDKGIECEKEAIHILNKAT